MPKTTSSTARRWKIPIGGLRHAGTHDHREIQLTLKSDAGETTSSDGLNADALIAEFRNSDEFKKLQTLRTKLDAVREDIVELEQERQEIEDDIAADNAVETLEVVLTELKIRRDIEAACLAGTLRAHAAARRAAEALAKQSSNAAFVRAMRARDEAQGELAAMLESHEAVDRFSDACAVLDRINAAHPGVAGPLIRFIGASPTDALVPVPA